MSAALIADKLRASLLQAAIQGKLTKQLAEDGDARDLLKEIEAEKARLIEEKIIKKEKPLPPITEDEIPFEIPENWVWVRFNEVLDVRDGTHDTPKYQVNGIPLVTSKNLKNNTIDFSNVKFISEEDAEKINNRSKVDIGDIIFAMIGSIGNPVINTSDRIFCIKNVALFKNFSQKINIQYLYLYLLFIEQDMRNNAAGGVQRFVSLTALRNYILPLPPLTEQHRIVEAIEIALAKIDKLKTDETKLDDIQKAFPNKLRASLLQSAIQGQLTEQLPEDGNARDLLKEIEAEKARLIEEKIIKKEKTLPPITEEEIPFEIPENWAWVRLGDLSIFINGDRSANYPTEKDFVPTGIPFFGAKDMIRNQLGYNPNLRFISEEKFKSLRSGKLQHLDFVCLLRGSIGKYAFFPKNEKFDTGFINAQMVIIRALHIEMVHYFESLFKSYYFESFIKEASSGTAVKQLAAETLRALMIPLPPLAEQERIVKKLDEILGKVDGLKKITQ